MQNNMQIWLESSTTTFNLNSHDEGVYLVSDLDGLTSLPEIRTSAGVNAGTDGGWTSAQAFDARLISLNIVIANEDESIVESKRRTLNSLLAQSRKESLKLHFISEAGMEYVISVRVTNVSGALSNILKKQNLLIQMRADDPIIYGAQGGEGVDATLTVQQAQGGFEIPFDIPLIIDGGTDKVNVENLGSEEVYPVIKMTGPLHNPTVVNETQNAEIGVNADLGDMEWRGYKSAEIYGNTTQTTLSGKNLLKIKMESATSGGLTWTLTDETISLSGTASSISSNSTYWTPPTPLPAGTYTFSIPQAIAYKTRLQIIDENGTAHAFGEISAGSVSGTQDSSWQIHQMRLVFIGWTPGDSVDISLPNKLQLEAGSTPTDYVPYVGGSDSPNPDYPQPIYNVTGGQTVKITGKNLADNNIPDITGGSGSTTLETLPTGVRCKYIGTSSSTATRQRYYATTLLLDSLIGQTLTLRVDMTPSGSNLGRIQLGYSLADTSEYVSLGSLDGNKPKQYTIPEEARGYYLALRFYANKSTPTAPDDYVDYTNLQLELGSTATTYEPYQAQSYEINLGKNLFNKDNANILTAYISGGKVITSANNNTTIYIPCKPNTTYTISKDVASGVFRAGTTSTIPTIGATIDGYVNAPTSASITLTTDASAKYIVAFVKNETSTQTEAQVLATVQIEAGSTATPYAPYKTPMELCKIDTYQDYIYKSGDKWYKHAEIGKVVYTGASAESWSIYANNNAFYITKSDTAQITPSSSLSVMACDYYTPSSLAAVYDGTVSYGIALGSSNRRINVRNKDCADVSAFKTWLSTHNTTVYYPLATPTDTEITDSELVEQLEALLDYAPWYGDDQNVFLIPSAGADGTLILGPHNEPKPADVVLIDTQLKTVTLNGQNAYPLLKDGSSFFTLAPGDNTMYLTSDVSSDTGKAEIKFKQGFISI